MRKRVMPSLALAVLLLLVALPAALAQEPTPPTWIPPRIHKSANTDELMLGDPVTFTIVVQNNDGATWYNVRVTDDVDPALRIDSASSTRGTVTITGQQVVVDGGITLAPGDQFVITVNCTLIGPVVEGQVITNTARLEYTDEGGNPQPPVDVDEPVEIIVEQEGPPVVPEASTLLLLGSAATGLAGYVGLQIRARRRRDD